MTAVTQAISERRSARAYLSRPVSAGLVRDIIEAAEVIGCLENGDVSRTEKFSFGNCLTR